MNGKDLFIQLALQLRSFPEAAVLWIFIKNQCDVSEKATTFRDMHFDELGELVSRMTVKRTLERLVDLGLVQTRPHKNTRTLVSVNREAVLELLRKPLINDFRLPGISQKEFPFLDAWNADIAQAKEDGAIAVDVSTTDHDQK